MRKLSAEEAELWSRVAATIRPLSRDPVELPTKLPNPTPVAPVPPKTVKGRVPPPRVVVAPAAVPRTLQQATLDGGWDRRLKTGRIDPDRTLDLHGHNLDRAWNAIDVALEDAIRQESRVLLLITGHERRGEPPLVRGRIRAAVHDWLAHSRHARHIAAVRGAHPRHGGGGSLYIILRRPGASTFS
ncbi:Smr/MutS family protein [Sphingomonas sp. LY29]|uniref:Smr/MutS family protein n=1 Tax=Sphingomonas sp. LY29 TaxID=3095341 RepID=UPI002D76C43D|nr:Smr/MutS family protein [Sphingomonas sp. LY29]WRP25883.1 Smr/MutS family protein [Sphingomonas sp. LY29]